jgi:2-aminoadipate transaminase
MEIKHLKSMDKEGRVIYTSTFSKILSPGLRLGWIAANEMLSEKLVLAKQHIDVCTSALIQHIAYEAIKGGIIKRNLPNTKKLYKQKRDRMLNAMEQNFPEVCNWTKPVGGLFIFAWVPEKIDTGEMIKECVQKEKVAYLPGKPFYVDGKGTNTMRLNFTYPSMEMIDEGIQRIGKVIKQKIM